MTSTDRPTYFLFLGDVFRDAREALGLTQDQVARRGGPSKPKQTELEGGTWQSTRPNDMLRKIDEGLGLPQGTARRVLYEEFDPIAAGLLKLPDGRTVGGLTQDAGKGYVSAPGAKADGGASDSEVLDAIREVQRELQRMSERLERLEGEGS